MITLEIDFLLIFNVIVPLSSEATEDMNREPRKS